MIELQELVTGGRVVPQRGGWRYCRTTRQVAEDSWQLPRRTILIGDAVDKLRTLPAASVDCCVTSPPFYMLRDYGVPGQIGLEPNVSEWVTNLRGVMHEVARVLRPTGGLWLNLGDSFSRHDRYGAPPKGLLCAPERLVLALAEAGWVVRNRVVWAKPNPMPTSVMDRLNLTHETVFYLVRSAHRYYFDLDAIREPHRSRGNKRGRPPLGKVPSWAGPLAGSQDGLRRARPDGVPGHVLGKNPGDVWQIPTSGFRGAHFATFPEELVRKPLLATCPEKVCTVCNQPWRRAKAMPGTSTGAELGDLVPCGCGSSTMPGVVLDPFMGSGTVAVVAERLGRDWLGIELNPSYGELATQRIETARRRRQGGQPKEVMSTNHEKESGMNEEEQPIEQAERREPEQRETEQRHQPRIYVASLSDYNAGRLHGAWIDAAQDPESLLAGISEMLARSPEPIAEEWAIHDYEGFGRISLSEYEPIESVARLARGIAEYGESFSAWVSHLGSYEEEQLSRFEDCFMGEWPSLTDYAESLVDNLGLADELDQVVPELLQPYVSIDFASFGRDMAISGDIVAVETSDQNGLFIFEP